MGRLVQGDELSPGHRKLDALLSPALTFTDGFQAGLRLRGRESWAGFERTLEVGHDLFVLISDTHWPWGGTPKRSGPDTILRGEVIECHGKSRFEACPASLVVARRTM